MNITRKQPHTPILETALVKKEIVTSRWKLPLKQFYFVNCNSEQQKSAPCGKLTLSRLASVPVNCVMPERNKCDRLVLASYSTDTSKPIKKIWMVAISGGNGTLVEHLHTNIHAKSTFLELGEFKQTHRARCSPLMVSLPIAAMFIMYKEPMSSFK